jgi:hypothetical protein
MTGQDAIALVDTLLHAANQGQRLTDIVVDSTNRVMKLTASYSIASAMNLTEVA